MPTDPARAKRRDKRLLKLCGLAAVLFIAGLVMPVPGVQIALLIAAGIVTLAILPIAAISMGAEIRDMFRMIAPSRRTSEDSAPERPVIIIRSPEPETSAEESAAVAAVTSPVSSREIPAGAVMFFRPLRTDYFGDAPSLAVDFSAFGEAGFRRFGFTPYTGPAFADEAPMTRLGIGLWNKHDLDLVDVTTMVEAGGVAPQGHTPQTIEFTAFAEEHPADWYDAAHRLGFLTVVACNAAELIEPPAGKTLDDVLSDAWIGRASLQTYFWEDGMGTRRSDQAPHDRRPSLS